jgi:hypothetical protein
MEKESDIIIRYGRVVEHALRQMEFRFEKTVWDDFRLTFTGNNSRDIIVVIHVGEQWAQLFCLFTGRPVMASFKLYQWMLKKSHTFPLVKFSVNENEEFLLQIDVPVESLDVRTIQTSLQAIVYAADRLYPEYLEVLGSA